MSSADRAAVLQPAARASACGWCEDWPAISNYAVGLARLRRRHRGAAAVAAPGLAAAAVGAQPVHGPRARPVLRRHRGRSRRRVPVLRRRGVGAAGPAAGAQPGHRADRGARPRDGDISTGWRSPPIPRSATCSPGRATAAALSSPAQIQGVPAAVAAAFARRPRRSARPAMPAGAARSPGQPAGVAVPAAATGPAVCTISARHAGGRGRGQPRGRGHGHRVVRRGPGRDREPSRAAP